MAVDFDPTGLGASPDATPTPPPRETGTEYVRNQAIDLGRGVVQTAGDVAAAAGYKPGQDLANYIADEATNLKSARGQFVERHPEQNKGGVLDDIVSTAMGVVPQLPAFAASEAAIPLVGPALAGATFQIGSTRNTLRRYTQDSPVEELQKNKLYRDLIASGKSDEEARDQMYDTANDYVTNLISAGTGAVGGGAAGLVLKGALRGLSGKEMSEAATNAIMRRAFARFGAGAAEGFVAGEAQGAGGEYAEKQGEANIGVAPQPTIGEALKAGLKPGLTFAAMGGAAHTIWGRPRDTTKATDTKVPDIGTEQEAAATDQNQATTTTGADTTRPAAPSPAPPPTTAIPPTTTEALGGPPPFDLVDLNQRRASQLPPVPPPPPPPVAPPFRQRFSEAQGPEPHPLGPDAGFGGFQNEPPAEPFFARDEKTGALNLDPTQAIAFLKDLNAEGSPARIDELKLLRDKYSDDIMAFQKQLNDLRRMPMGDMDDDQKDVHRTAIMDGQKKLDRALDQFDQFDKEIDIARQQSAVARQQAAAARRGATPEEIAAIGQPKPKVTVAGKLKAKAAAKVAERRASNENIAEGTTAAPPEGLEGIETIRPSGEERLLPEAANQGGYKGTLSLPRGTKIKPSGPLIEKEVRELPVDQNFVWERDTQNLADTGQRVRVEPNEIVSPPTPMPALSRDAVLRKRADVEKAEAEKLAREDAAGQNLSSADLTRVIRQIPWIRSKLAHLRGKESERARKGRRTAVEYDEREANAKEAVLNKELAPSKEELDDLLSGDKEGGTSFWKLPYATVEARAKDAIKSMQSRIELARRLNADHTDRMRRKGRSPQISWRIGFKSEGENTGLWHNRLVQYRRLADERSGILPRIIRSRLPQGIKRSLLREELVSHFIKERYTQEERPHKLLDFVKEEKSSFIAQLEQALDETKSPKDAKAISSMLDYARDMRSRFEEEQEAGRTESEGLIPYEDYDKMADKPEFWLSGALHAGRQESLEGLLNMERLEKERRDQVNSSRKYAESGEYGPSIKPRRLMSREGRKAVEGDLIAREPSEYGPETSVGKVPKRSGLTAQQSDLGLTAEGKFRSDVKAHFPPPNQPWLKLNSYEKSMVRRYGEGWLKLSDAEKKSVQEYGDLREQQNSYGVGEDRKDRVRRLLDRATQLHDMIAAMPEHLYANPTRANLRSLHEQMRAIMGEHPVTDQPVTKELIDHDINRAADELDEIEREMRGHYEEVVPNAKTHEVGLGSVLDRQADLGEPGTMPAGSFRVKAASLLRRDDFGVRPGDEAGAAIRNHFLDIVHKVAGDMDVVVLTPEQMVMAARDVGVPGDSPAFYDPKSNRIFIDRTSFHGNNRSAILTHEFAHALTEEALDRYPEIAKNLDEMRDLVKDKYTFNEDVREALKDNRQALDNVHEFLAHLWQNGSPLPAILHDIKTTSEQRARFETEERGNALTNVLRSIKRGLTGLFWNVSKKRLLNDATINSLDLFHKIEEEGRRPSSNEALPYGHGNMLAHAARDLMEGVSDKAKDFRYRLDRQGNAGGLLMRLHSMRYLAGMTRDARFNETVEKIIDQLGRNSERQKLLASKVDGPMIKKLVTTLKNLAPERQKELADYINDENQAGVFGSSPLGNEENKFVDPNDIRHRHLVNAHEGLEARWNALPSQVKDTIRDLRKYYSDRHEANRRAAVNHMIRAAGMVKDNDPTAVEGLIKHISREDVSPTERTAMEANIPGYAGHTDPAHRTAENNAFISEIGRMRNISEFRKLQGPFYPMMRHGDYAVRGHYDISDLAKNGKEDPNEPGTFQFDNEKDAKDFIDRLTKKGVRPADLPDIHVNDVYKRAYETDKQGNVVMQDGQPKRAGYTDDKGNWMPESVKRVEERLQAGDPVDAKIVHIVETNPRLLEYHPSERLAHERLQDLKQDKRFIPKSLEVRKETPGDRSNPVDASSGLESMITGVKNSPSFRAMSASDQAAFNRVMHEEGVRNMLTKGARSKYLPRERTLGADRGIVKNLQKYGHNTSFTLAEREGRPAMDAAVKAMDDHVRETSTKEDPQGLRRSQVAREVHRRLAMTPDSITSGWLNKSINAFLKMSYLDKLGSPSFLVLNSTEPWLLGAPQLAAEHGIGAYAEMARAYRTMGFGDTWKTGIQDFIKVLREGPRADPELANHFKAVIQRVADSKDVDHEDLAKMLTFLQETGYLDRDAGMELAKIFDPDVSAFGRGLDYLDSAVRQLNATVETINRSVLGISAYRLARRNKKMNHEDATRYAQQIVERAAGNYANYNAPPIFSHQHFRFAMQFKKYALRVSENYMRMFAGAFHYLRGNIDDPTAAKQLMAMLASQTLMSGALGLPTEPLKALITSTNVLGLNPYNTDDVEAMARRGLADQVGPVAAEGFLRGLPRLLNIGIGTRTGHDTLWTYGTMGGKPDDWFTALGHLFAGAPGGLLADYVQGMQKFFTGAEDYFNGSVTVGGKEITEGVQLLLPLKIASDAIGVAHDTAFGRQTPSGQPSGRPMDAFTSGMNFMGMRTGQQQEESEARGVYRRQTQQRQQDRQKALQMYAAASTPAEKAAIRRSILENYNDGLPIEQRITVGDMLKYDRAYHTKQRIDPSLLGVSVNRRTRGAGPPTDVYRYQ